MCLRQVSKDSGSHPTPRRLRAQSPAWGAWKGGAGWPLSTSSARGKPQHRQPWRKWHCPQPGVWPSQDGKEASRGGGRGQGRVGEEEGEGGCPRGPRTQLPGTPCRCHIGPGPSPSHLMSCHSPQGHSPALKGEGEDREGGRRPPKHRQPGRELPLSQGLVPWPQ